MLAADAQLGAVLGLSTGQPAKVRAGPHREDPSTWEAYGPNYGLGQELLHAVQKEFFAYI